MYSCCRRHRLSLVLRKIHFNNSVINNFISKLVLGIIYNFTETAYLCITKSNSSLNSSSKVAHF